MNKKTYMLPGDERIVAGNDTLVTRQHICFLIHTANFFVLNL